MERYKYRVGQVRAFAGVDGQVGFKYFLMKLCGVGQVRGL